MRILLFLVIFAPLNALAQWGNLSQRSTEQEAHDDEALYHVDNGGSYCYLRHVPMYNFYIIQGWQGSGPDCSGTSPCGAGSAPDMWDAEEHFCRPSCTIKSGTKVAWNSYFGEGWEYADEDDCYAMCQYVAVATETTEPIVCTFTGAPVAEPLPDDPTDAPFGNLPDPNDPDYCNVPGAYEGECLDADHPSNEGGCQSQYGTVNFGLGDVAICAPSDGGANPGALDTSQDIDGDGIPNWDDPDIDGDGIPNTADNDSDGDGVPNNLDGNPDGDQGSGEGSDGDDADTGDGTATGLATTCNKRPQSTGDPQLAAIHLQLWLNECKGDQTLAKAIDDLTEKMEGLTEEVGDGEAENITEGALTEASDELDDILDDHIAGVESGAESGGPMSGIVEGSGLDDLFSDLVPSAGSCSPMQFQFLSKINMPIPCQRFEEFKAVFGWALYILTAYSIVMVAVNSAPKE
ncbi:hypothetical protein [Spongiibacter tropicus]|uniref:hypothetical protein n=1 Tax=Spongiibacter tropicus TaxID=454602 RepID=UPI00300A04FC